LSLIAVSTTSDAFCIFGLHEEISLFPFL